MIQMNLKVAKKHAEDALRLARNENSHQGVIESYRLLIQIFEFMGNEGRAKDFLHKSIKYAEANLGPESLVFADQLSVLADYEGDRKPEKAEQLMRRYVSIYETNGDNKLTVEAYNCMIEFFMLHDKPKDAEVFQLKQFALAKETFGPFYDDLEQHVTYYALILQGLKRDEERLEILEISDRCFHINYFKEKNEELLDNTIETICGGTEDFRPPADQENKAINCRLEDLRCAVEVLHQIGVENSKRVHEQDLFVEMRRKAGFMPYFFAKTKLAHAVRREAIIENSTEGMLEAAVLFKELAEECLGDSRNRKFHVLAVIELARMDAAFAADAASAIAALPDTTERLYTTALMMIMQNSDPSDTRAALRQAVMYNEQVLKALEKSFSQAETSSDEWRERAKRQIAITYAKCFGHLWRETPGAIDLLKDVSAETNDELQRLLAETKNADNKCMTVLRALLNVPVC